ncbi:unnamed protein product [Dovyalis caffra]|uniref:Uncharacterized protein n=1 Tax=Dovyalis caffra TaxID=77055 RepID=A0AAV1RZU9_9ROSI|nr:unnamed protein product [Dovyalis caffra]
MAETLNIVIENGASSNSSVSNDEWLKSIMAGEGETGNSQQIVPRIHKVPPVLRGIHSKQKCYDPMVVSVGPYHHGKPELYEVERIKATMARRFVQDSGKPIEVLYNKVEKVANSARKYYDEGSTERFGNEEFAHMMFLDGCFIIQFIYCFVKEPEDLRMNGHISALIKRDIFLLENQLPFQVLNTMMSLRFKGEAEGKKLFIDFITKHVRGLPPPSESYKQIIMKFVSKYTWPSRTDQTRTEKKELGDHQPAHLLELLHKELSGRKAIVNNSTNGDADLRSFRSAKELKTVGISFRPSRTDHDLLTGVRFKSTLRGGILELPPIFIDDSTKSVLLNLVAYETCPDASQDLRVNSYICFMDSLIDHADDVKELRSKGILYNFLGSDQQVADLFNEISDYLVPNPDAYHKVQHKIESHYRNLIKKWIAEWLHTHFNSPWAFLAFAAAVFAIILSSIQTYKALFPSEDNEGRLFCSCTTNLTKMN